MAPPVLEENKTLGFLHVRSVPQCTLEKAYTNSQHTELNAPQASKHWLWNQRVKITFVDHVICLVFSDPRFVFTWGKNTYLKLYIWDKLFWQLSWHSFFFFFKSTNLNSFTHWWEKKIVWKLKKSFLWKQLHFSEGKPFHDICQPTYVGRRQKPSTIVEKKHVLRCVLFPCFVHFRFPGDSQSRKLKNCSLSPLQNLCCFSSPVTDSGWD